MADLHEAKTTSRLFCDILDPKKILALERNRFIYCVAVVLLVCIPSLASLETHLSRGATIISRPEIVAAMRASTMAKARDDLFLHFKACFSLLQSVNTSHWLVLPFYIQNRWRQ